MYIKLESVNNDVNKLIYKCKYLHNNIICKLIRLKDQSNASLKKHILTRDINCLIVSAYFIESGRLFQSLGAAIENAKMFCRRMYLWMI